MSKINTILSLQDDMSPALNTIAINLNNMMGVFSKLMNVGRRISRVFGELSSAYQFQSEVETKLTTVARQRFNATEEEIQQMKNLASSLQQVGIYGDEMILQGMQELSTYAEGKDAVMMLTPVMADLVAQQYGFSASAESMRNASTMIGKVLSGEVGGLKRWGYTFTQEQEKILKTGTEMERTATLVDVITSNIGEMNTALAGTNMGGIQNMNNQLGDLNERLGAITTQINSQVSQVKGQIILALEPIITKVLGLINKHLPKLMVVIPIIGGLAVAWIAKIIAKQVMLNAKVYAIIGIIGVAVGLIGAVINGFNKANSGAGELDSTISNIKIGMGIVAEVVMFVYHTIEMAVKMIYDAVAILANAIIEVINFGKKIANVFGGKYKMLNEMEFKSLNTEWRPGSYYSDMVSGKSEIGNIIGNAITGTGAIRTADENTLVLSDKLKELLSIEATRKFNLKFVTPTVNMGGVNINESENGKGSLQTFVNSVQRTALSAGYGV